MHSTFRLKASRLAACCICGVILVLGGCDGDSKDASDKGTPTPAASGEPNNRPSVSPEAGPVPPQSNASFAERRSIELGGAQQVPVVATRAAGTADLSLGSSTGQLSGTLTHSVPDATGASIRSGAAGQSGEALVQLETDSDSSFVVPAGTVLDAGQQEDYRAGRLYLVISSETYPEGEIRGQISDAPVAVTIDPRLDDIQAKVFTPVCSGCHTGTGTSLPAVMDLTTAEASYNSLVNFASLGEPELLRVEAGFPDDSLVVHKLLGTQQVGSRMPFRGKRLDTDKIDAIREWIAAGAPR